MTDPASPTLRDLITAIETAPEAATREIVDDAPARDDGGGLRQAGATPPADEFIDAFRLAATRTLFVFAHGVLGLTRLTPTLHKPICALLQRAPPYRKLLLLPRDHLKSSMVAKALPIHLLIQPQAANGYLPGRHGANTRILLANETATNAEHFLRWVMMKFEGNPLLRRLWPHAVWANARRDSKKWNEKEMLVPRTEDFPEASVETIGVGGAITSRHYDVLIKDDLISVAAANSEVEMETAIEWHRASRALMDDPDKSLEFIVGTRWAVHDLYDYIIETDPTVEVYKRAVVEDGQPIFPEMFSLDTIGRLAEEFGTLFPLLYMNDATDPALTAFDVELLREFRVEGGELVFEEDERDLLLAERHTAPPPRPDAMRGLPLNAQTWPMVLGRDEYLRLKAR